MYSNCYCNCSFEPEIIKIGQLSHKMYSNNILNFQESTAILNAVQKSLETSLNNPRMTLSGATTPGQSGSGNDSNEEVLHIFFSITKITLVDCFVSYQGHSSVEDLTDLLRNSRCILQVQPTEQ